MDKQTYNILVEYETGNSFGRHDEEKLLDHYFRDINQTKTLYWKNLDIAKQNLERIKLHYEWYNYLEAKQKYYFDDSEEEIKPPGFVLKYFKLQPSYFDKQDGAIKWYEYTHYIPIILDDGSEIELCCFWCGYFERLYGASVQKTKPDGWSFRV